MTMLCPPAPMRMTRTSVNNIPLWRWLLGGLVPLGAILLTHNGVIAGSRGEFLLWRDRMLEMGLPVLVIPLALVPALLILLAHLTNQYFLQGIGRLSAAHFLRMLLAVVPTLVIVLLMTSIIVPIVVLCASTLLFPIFLLLGRLSAAASQFASTGLFVLLIAAIYLICGYLVGKLLPDVERFGIVGPTIDTDAMKIAHRRGGALAAGLILAGQVGILSSPTGWSELPWARAALLDKPMMLVAVVMIGAWLPHLLMTWRAISAAGPEIPVVPLSDFVPRLMTVLFVIGALAAVEGTLLGGSG
jgi:hypothetical protein